MSAPGHHEQSRCAIVILNKPGLRRRTWFGKDQIDMDSRYICYCGLYCENCAVKARVEPASKRLYAEMKKAGFEDIIEFFPQGTEFWTFLKSMAEEGTCTSCREGSGNPGCAVRRCALEKKVEVCALCGSYPCGHFAEFFAAHPILRSDNALLRDQGLEKWSKLQDDRRAADFIYVAEKAD